MAWFGSHGATTLGIGEAPSSRLKKFGIFFAVALIILFITMDFVERANVNKPNYTGLPSTAAADPEG
jgi:hypothetical protein